jgi:DNA-binding GntR family transcriptional regulator
MAALGSPIVATSILTAARRQRSDRGSRGELAYQQIKERIVSLELPPASVIDETQLMQALSLGRTPIREAVQRLAWEHLIVIVPRRGMFVADINPSDLQKIFEVRVELEGCAARLAAERATPDEVKEMNGLFVGAEAILQAGGHRELIGLDHRAHQLVARAAHNEYLEDTLERMFTHTLRLWQVSLHKVGRLRQMIEEHRQVIAAIEAHDGALAERVMRAHIVGFQKAFKAVL